ncbi:hypothetical protein CDFC105_72944 [Clostridioides difficile]|nr:hypothetical protein CDFC105_64165 [Clostridioides difficile]CZS08892.1 hypothetical protein CDFC105_72944 [Clostridioides difficile]
MGLNIFNIWEKIGKKTPFAVRRTHWSNKEIYVIVDKVESDGKGYGKAYGIPTENGGFCSYWQNDKKWKENRLIPNNGVYGWEYVEGVPLEIQEKNVNKRVVETKKMKKPINGIYDIDTNLDFGKYRNLEIKEIINLNPNYLIWAIKNIDKFKLSCNAINILCEKLDVNDDVVQMNNKK